MSDAICVCNHAIEDHIVTGTETRGYGRGKCLKPGCKCRCFISLQTAQKEADKLDEVL